MEFPSFASNILPISSLSLSISLHTHKHTHTPFLNVKGGSSTLSQDGFYSLVEIIKCCSPCNSLLSWLLLGRKCSKLQFHATTTLRVSYYDYIVVGGGTSGCALAATLSEKYKVVLLERGGSPYGNPNITRVEPWVELMTNGSLGSPSQPFVSEDGVNSVRPRMLGGGTSINDGFYSRAQTSYVREARWNGKLVNESFRWVENKVVFQPLVRGWQSALRDGMVEAKVTPYNGFTYDHVTGTKVGGTIVDGQGNRHTSADLLEYANPRRITVFFRATVHRILFNTKGTSRPVANGLVFTDTSGRRHRAYLNDGFKNEIILCGALGSPQLLMLSGLGPKEHLKSHKIKVVLDQPLVGQGMKDNPMNNVFIPSLIPVDIDAIMPAAITPFGN